MQIGDFYSDGDKIQGIVFRVDDGGNPICLVGLDKYKQKDVDDGWGLPDEKEVELIWKNKDTINAQLCHIRQRQLPESFPLKDGRTMRLINNKWTFLKLPPKDAKAQSQRRVFHLSNKTAYPKFRSLSC